MTYYSTSIGTLYVPHNIAFMYSRVPVFITNMTVADGTPIQLSISRHDDPSRMYTETHYVYDKRVDFDASAAMRHLANDVKSVFTPYDIPYYPCVEFDLSIRYNESAVKTVAIIALYGALNPGEEYGMSWGIRRIYMKHNGNRLFPVTVPFWWSSGGSSYVLSTSTGLRWELCSSTRSPLAELDILRYLYTSNNSLAKQIYAELKAGRDVSVQASSRSLDFEDNYIQYDNASLILRPVFIEPKTGKMLRWLSRDGTFGYWYFDASAYQTDATQRSAFTAYKEGDIRAAQYDEAVWVNPVCQDFIETRKVVLSTRYETKADYDYLCNLALSPVVQMFDDDLGFWREVNVVPGSYTRRHRFNTPRVQEFSISIELPPRDLVTL